MLDHTIYKLYRISCSAGFSPLPFVIAVNNYVATAFISYTHKIQLMHLKATEICKVSPIWMIQNPISSDKHDAREATSADLRICKVKIVSNNPREACILVVRGKMKEFAIPAQLL